MMESLQFLDIFIDVLHTSVKLTVKQYIPTAIFFTCHDPRQNMLINSIKEHAPGYQIRSLSDFCRTE